VLLYEGRVERLGKAARRALETSDAVASPMAILELEFLHEIGRLKPKAPAVAAALKTDLGLQICRLPFDEVVDEALQMNWGRDPFDRLIVASAKADRAPLITRDERMHESYPRAIW
jgi:PIN domain nuclease of toxin-antitoxin system